MLKLIHNFPSPTHVLQPATQNQRRLSRTHLSLLHLVALLLRQQARLHPTLRLLEHGLDYTLVTAQPLVDPLLELVHRPVQLRVVLAHAATLRLIQRVVVLLLLLKGPLNVVLDARTLLRLFRLELVGYVGNVDDFYCLVGLFAGGGGSGAVLAD